MSHYKRIFHNRKKLNPEGGEAAVEASQLSKSFQLLKKNSNQYYDDKDLLLTTIVASAIMIALIEFVYTKGQEEEDAEECRFYALRLQRIMRWTLRRYGPNMGGLLIKTILHAPIKATQLMDIPSISPMVGEVMQAAVEDAFSYKEESSGAQA